MRNIVLTIGVSAVFGAACAGAALSGAPVALRRSVEFRLLAGCDACWHESDLREPHPVHDGRTFQGKLRPLPMLNEDTEIGPFKTISRQVPCLPGVQSPSAEASMSMRSNGTDEGDPPPSPSARPFGL